MFGINLYNTSSRGFEAYTFKRSGGGGSVIGLNSLRQYDPLGRFVRSRYDVDSAPLIGEEILTTLKGEYLDKLIDTCSSMSTLGSFQKLLVIIKELNDIKVKSNYDILMIEVFKLFTSLIQKSQSQYVEILLQKRKK